MAAAAQRVRSALFTPGTEPARLRKAVGSGADICIFDLEDSVPPARLAEARRTVSEALREIEDGLQIWVRIHSAATSEMVDDLAALPLTRLTGIVVPKVGGAAELAACRAAILASKGSAGLPLMPIIESALGVLNASDIAGAPDVFCVAYGRFDLSADLGIDPDGGSPALAAARAALVLTSTAHRLHPPLESPWLTITDLDGLREAALRARADGFGGMLLIHPSHVAIVNEVFSPTPQEIKWASDIIASSAQSAAEGRGAYSRDGAMVDEAIIRRARGILEQASTGGTP